MMRANLIAGILTLSVVVACGAAGPHVQAAEPKVMFSACTPGHPAGPGLFFADADFSNPIRLTSARPDLFPEGFPGSVSGCDIGAWSPDGTRAVVSRNMHLYMLDLVAMIQFPGQEPVPIEDESGRPRNGGNPAWSPDGSRIAFHNGDGIAVVNPDGTGYRVVAPLGIRVRDPEWSPDGAAIAFRYCPYGRAYIYVVTDLDGPGEPRVRQLTNTDDYDTWPHWSPDSSTLAFTRAPARTELQFGDIWLVDVESGEATQLTDTPEVSEQCIGWPSFDGKIYYMAFVEGSNTGDFIVRMRPDGSDVERFPRDILPSGKITWARVGAWIEGASALPGEEVAVKVGMQDAEGLAEVTADIAYTACCNTLDITDAILGKSIGDWIEETPVIDGRVVSVGASSPDPGSQTISGPSHLFDLHVANTVLARPGDIQLLTFEDLYLADGLGRALPVPALAGGVRTIPFASLHLSVRSKKVYGDGRIALWIELTACDRDGDPMPDYTGPVHLGAYAPQGDYMTDPNKLVAARPSSVRLRNGSWAGRVVVPALRAGVRLIAYWGDIAAQSDPLTPVPQG